jgi:hypothetical protein
MANVFSIGDLLILGGVAWGAHRICGSRLVPRWTPPRPDGADPERLAAGQTASV